ncbi:hypothetical protein ATI61_10269 [Archangium gephyra]|uniref:DUF3592 domain-containing protein n=1 Tax=Archangium gephyra TaxID=48 RepID=A0AAC8TGC5_9BACT|nr:hypothetical protein [Archangium gephyra]AKJ04997.1 Hypothetical protein AA314_06623 [Archangium gephyra]REG35701.1 hypothetical protein ATI61_10269 [Archangium gephyra]
MRLVNLGCLTLMLGPFVFGFASFELSLLHGLSRELYSMTYPSVMGTITNQGMETLSYAYEIGGQTFQGNNYRYTVKNEDDYKAWSGPEFRSGSPVRVYYRRGSPWESVLVPGVQGRTLLLLLGFTPVNLAIIGGLFLMLDSTRKSRLGVRAFQRNGGIHVRLTDRTPLLVGFWGALAASIALAIIVGVVMGLDAPLTAVALAWAFAVAAGVGIAMWWQTRLDTGDYDLILDEQAQRLSLPPMHERTKRRDLEWSAIQEVILDKETRNGKGGFSEYYRCMLRLRGGSRAELVTEWKGDQDRAANLVNWLQARLGRDESMLVAPPAPAPAPKKKKVRY